MNSDYIRDKDKEHYIEDFTGTYREIKKWYREIIYNKKGQTIYSRLVDYRTGATVIALGSICDEPLAYRVKLTCPDTSQVLLKRTDFKDAKGRVMASRVKCWLDIFDISKVTKDIEFNDFYVKDHNGKVCRVIAIEKLYGKQYER